MKELVPLIRLISKKKISDKYILKSGKELSKQDALYLAIKKGELNSDEEAFSYLYPGGGNLRSFNRMKHRLKEKLVNGLLTIDFSHQKYTSLGNAQYKVMKQYIIGRLLTLEGLRDYAVPFMEDALKQAVKFDITEIVKLIAKFLVQHFSVQVMDDKKLRKYQQIYQRYLEIESQEFKADMYYYELSRMYYQKVSKKGYFLDRLRQYTAELAALQPQINSFDFNHKTYSIKSTLYIFERDYQEAIRNADEAISFFESKPFETVRHKFTFNSDKIMALILLGRHQEAEGLIEETISLFQNKTFNYYRLYFFHFLNYSQGGELNKLYEVVNHVLSSSTIANYNIHYELWRIREAYVYFLIEAGVVDIPEEIQLAGGNFRLARFINEVPIFSREKRGMNVAILVIQLLFLIARKRYNEVIDRMDALKQYSFRYLRNDDTFRSNCFIKMLAKIPQADFHPVRTRLYTQDLEKRLHEHQVDIQELTNEIEVIPYGSLWDILLQVLEKNKINS